MPAHSKPQSASRIAIIYLTVGALMAVWSGVWYLWLREMHPEQRGSYFWCMGLLLSGVVLMVIGLAVGRIGRAAAHADLTPEQATGIPKPDQNAANRLPTAVPGSVPVQIVPVPPVATAATAPAGVNQAAPPARRT